MTEKKIETDSRPPSAVACKDGLSFPSKKKGTFFTGKGTRYILNRHGLIELLESWRETGISAVLSTHKYGYKLKINSVGWVVRGATVEELIENLTELTEQYLK